MCCLCTLRCRAWLDFDFCGPPGTAGPSQTLYSYPRAEWGQAGICMPLNEKTRKQILETMISFSAHWGTTWWRQRDAPDLGRTFSSVSRSALACLAWGPHCALGHLLVTWNRVCVWSHARKQHWERWSWPEFSCTWKTSIFAKSKLPKFGLVSGKHWVLSPQLMTGNAMVKKWYLWWG